MSGEFIEGSKAIGILAVIYSHTNDSLTQYGLVPRISRQQRVSANFDCFSNGPRSISLFIVEENGLPFDRVASKVKSVVVDTSNSNNDITSKYVYLYI